MTFACAGFAQEDDVLGTIYVVAARKLADGGGGDLRGVLEVEVLETFEAREACFCDAAMTAALGTIVLFGFEQCAQIGQMALVGPPGLRDWSNEEWGNKIRFEPRLLDADFEPPTFLPRRGSIEFIRLIRSDRTLKVLGSKIDMPEEVVHRYVVATLHVRTQRVVIEAEGHPWSTEFPFPLKF